MTQAFNLSQLGNGVNTSGQLNAATYLYNQVPVANGGTGLSTLTAGYVPFGNGTGAFGSSNSLVYDSSNVRFGVGTATPAVKMSIVGTDAVLIPVGTTAQRPTGAAGYLRFNSTLSQAESYNGTSWLSLITGTNGIASEASGGTGTTTGYYGFKNRIINGAMVIDARNAGASVATTVTGTPTYTLDRFAYQSSQASKYTVQQNAAAVTPPTGFLNYLGVTSTSAYSVLTGDYFLLRQPIEGFNTADLGFGTASASTVTLSFWVRSSLTGTFGGSLGNGSRSYPFSYTISVANTWEQKSITIAGDTSGTWVGATNGTGMILAFSLGMGSTYSTTAGAWAAGNYLSATGATSVVGTNGATFYVTGVQLEKGSTATSFDYRPYGTELALCQRYFQLMDMGYVYSYAPSGNQITSNYTYPVAMRATSTVAVVTNPTFGSGTSVSSYQTTARMTAFYMITNGAGYATWVGGQFSASAEL